jgi:hypothetical protein
MEDLITIFIFLAIAAISIFQKVRRNKKKAAEKAGPPKAPKPGSLTYMINDFFSKIQERIEVESNRGPSSTEDWRQLMDDGSVAVTDQETLEDIVLDDDIFDDVYVPETKLKTAKPQIKSSREIEPPKQRSQVNAPMAPTDSRKPMHQSNRILPRGRMGLRKAVIWAEIIGPPVALRDKHPDR